MAYTTIDNPELYFQCKTYSGTGSAASITFDGSENMQPDIVWIKNRSTTGNHGIWDSVRGATKQIYPNVNYGESTAANSMTAFNSDGFSVGSDGDQNGSGNSLVAWCWKVNSSTVTNSSGNISATVAVNDSIGMSIMSYTGDGQNARSIGHSLSAKPKVYLIKARSYSVDWQMFVEELGAGGRLQLSTNEAFDTSSTVFGNTVPTSSLLYVGANSSTDSATNKVSATYICYAFRPIQGYSAMGTYKGNGDDSGPFIYTGFRPAMVIYKNKARAISWLIHDNKRLDYNPNNDEQHPDTNQVDGTDDRADILSNGFKIRESANLMNVDGEEVLYIAFAEAPFVNSKGVPCNAR